MKNAAVKITPSKEAAPKVDSTERENKMIWVEQFRVKNLSLNKIEEGSKLATSIGEAATYIKDIKILTQPEDGQRGFSYHLVELKAKDIVSPFKTGLHTMKIASLDMDSTNIDIKNYPFTQIIADWNFKHTSRSKRCDRFRNSEFKHT